MSKSQARFVNAYLFGFSAKPYFMPHEFCTYFNVKSTETILAVINVKNHEYYSLQTRFSSVIFLGIRSLYCLISFKLHFTDANEDDSALYFTE